ncbi:MAG TPA: hypothetical protein VJ911_08340, partial [Cryomorphaceae bacterium]|nr:hypothetical protein [Cryomorphaceae bacterium]
MRRIIRIVILIILAIGLAVGYTLYKRIYSTAVEIEGDETHFYIRTGWTEEDVLRELSNRDLIKG